MKIAVTYDNGNVFQHFGHTEEFMVYEAEAGKIISSQILVLTVLATEPSQIFWVMKGLMYLYVEE